MFLRKLFLKIKRWFYNSTCFYPEDFKKLVYVQKYLEHSKSNYKSYNDYIRDHFKNNKDDK